MLLLLGCLLSRKVSAAPASVVVEIDAAAERVVDSRSTRRLLPLELSDVAVPAGQSRGAPVLFFRVLGRADGSLRIELWERGEYHGQRALSSAGENPQLVARRVALAAAELGRRLARKRSAALVREERLRQARLAREQELAERTQEGPLALRSEVAVSAVPSHLWTGGTRLIGELTLRGRLRLDVGGELALGRLRMTTGWVPESSGNLAASLSGLSLGPAYRFALTSAWDIDAGARASALLLSVPAAYSLDAVPDQASSWSARMDAGLRLQVRLTRQVRASVGGELGWLLRNVRYVGAHHEASWLRGAWFGGSLGVVITPAQ